MTPKQIKIILLRQDLTIAGLAREFGCRREELRFCIYRQRKYPELQIKLAAKLGYSVRQLFGSSPNKKAA